MTQPTATIVVPCYNEADRLDGAAFESMLTRPGLELLFVDDGSTDDTAAKLQALSDRSAGRIRVLGLEGNCGKAEAVRRGMLQALTTSEIVGFIDADLATPPSEVLRLLDALEGTAARVVLGSRVKLLGREVQRRPARHYLGRVFASCASLALRLPVYDTQCGAKLFRRTPELSSALSKPFLSKWYFDVELLGRLVATATRNERGGVEGIVEEPLKVWRDVPGSKMKLRHMAAAVTDLARIAVTLRRRKR